MLTELFMFGLLCNTACSLPKAVSHSETDNSTSVNQKIPCVDQIEWVKNTTLEAKNLYEEYYKKFTENNIDVENLSTVKAEHQKIVKLIADSLSKYTIDLDKVRSKKVNAIDQWNICRDELKSFSIMNRNLTALTQSIRPKLIDFAKQLNLPPETIDDLDHTLGRIVNFMFIIDMGKKTFRDIPSMVKEAQAKTEDGIKLEDEYKFTEKGVDAVSELKEKVTIGRIEKPAIVKVEEIVFKPKKELEVVGKVEDLAAYNIVDSNPDDEKAFNDLIDFNDQDIVKSNKELEQREQLQAKTQRLAEEQRLAEQQRLEEEIRLQQEREIVENTIKFYI